MILKGLLFFTFAYVNGIVAGVRQMPVFWDAVKCRAQFEKVMLVNPDQANAQVFIRKRVYDQLIVDYHKLAPSTLGDTSISCKDVDREAQLVLDWLKRQKKVWGKNSESSFQKLIQQLEGHYDVSWR